MAEEQTSRTTPLVRVQADETMAHGVDVYCCAAHLFPEPDGRYSAILPQLPGVASQGKDLQDAVLQVSRALRVALQAYRAENMPIPWREYAEDPDAIVRQVIVSLDTDQDEE